MKRLLVIPLLVFMLAACAAPTTTPASTAPGSSEATQPMVETAAPSATMPETVNTPTTEAMATEMSMPTVEATSSSMEMPTPATSSSTQAAVPVTGTQTYSVLVGGEDMTRGADLMAFFPANLTIHVGDTVVWKQNSMEIHTVTFLAGQQLPAFTIPVPNGPQGAMMFNPLGAFPSGPKDGMYDGSTFASSGIMGKEQGQAQQYKLTFTKAGTYNYICVVHGQMMSGSIAVEDSSASVPTPDQASAQGKTEMDALMAKVDATVSAANAMVEQPVQNADGTTTYKVMIGYSDGQIDLMSFFPSKLNVHPGDTVVWTLGPKDVAPHTVTFLNGADEPPLAVPSPQGNGQMLLLFNPAVAVPQNVGQPITKQGIFNSGMMIPEVPPTHTFTAKIGNVSGDLNYLCLLHDSSGMTGTITVTAK